MEPSLASASGSWRRCGGCFRAAQGDLECLCGDPRGHETDSHRLWITPSIERHTTLFHGVWICALLGGIGRLVSMAVVGQPPLPMMIFTGSELPLVPVLLAWQSRVAAGVR